MEVSEAAAYFSENVDLEIFWFKKENIVKTHFF